MSELKLDRTWRLPLREMSALAIRSTEGAEQLVGVGDEDFAVVIAELRDGEVDVPEEATALRDALDDAVLEAPEGSEFEGVACDLDGRVFILQEGSARVLVLTSDLGHIRLRVNLAVHPGRPGWGSGWLEDRNSRGEAMLLLPDGHLLIAKQREPVMLIEFGPRNEPALGWTQETLANRATFPFDEEIEVDYDVLADWRLVPEVELPSINDLAVAGDGTLYALSAKARRIVRLEPSTEERDSAVVAAAWALPESLPGDDDAKPEGLTFLPGRTPLISIDTKESSDNLVRLEPIPKAA